MADAPADRRPPTPSDPVQAEAAARLRRAVEQLLARPPAVRRDSLTIGERSLAYRAQVDFLPVGADGFDAAGGEPDAAVMTTAYLLDDAPVSQRPVCFAFNGGPGSASVWLHLGALGPKRVVVPDDGSVARPPYAVQDNPQSWFEHFDLVFIDPPQTGWSIAASEDARKKLLSVDGDVAACAELIRVWLTRHRRWSSPVYLCGESYGTTRAAAMADRLQDSGIGLAGLILVSCAMDLQSLVFAPGNDLPYGLFVPGYAATAQYHGLLRGPLGDSPEAARQAAEAFVQEDYVATLQAGARASEAQRSRVARRLAELTGLPRVMVEELNLRIRDATYFFEALRPQGLIVGRLDSRCTAPMAARRTRDWEFDPGIEATSAPYTMAAMAYFAELGLDLDRRYETLSEAAHKAWDWRRKDNDGGGGYVATSAELARAMRRNPNLKVLAASGHYDLGTPYSATDWSLAQLDAPREVRERVTHRYYDAGHMMYTREADLRQLKADLAAWLT